MCVCIDHAHMICVPIHQKTVEQIFEVSILKFSANCFSSGAIGLSVRQIETVLVVAFFVRCWP